MQNFGALNTVNNLFNQTFGLLIANVFATKTQPQTFAESRINSTISLLCMARDVEESQPNLAAEFRNFASRS